MNEAITNPMLTSPLRPTIAVAGSLGLSYPVRRIWCVGRNYADHAKEMGHDPQREPPFFFSKPADAIVPGGGLLDFPPATNDLHHEVELAIALGGSVLNLKPEEVAEHIFGYAVALDMTRRDLQAEAKQRQRPWDLAKGFDQSCPISEIRRAADIGQISRGRLQLTVNGSVRQSGDVSEMIWSIAECISALSHFVRLLPGDIILTGTPAGVGPVVRGDELHATCEAVGELVVKYR